MVHFCKMSWRWYSRSRSQAGQTIIEVLIATVVVAMVLTAVAATLSVSVKNTSQARYQEVARTMAQSGLEVFRRERNILGWQAFHNALNSGSYCLNTLPADSSAFTTMPTGVCSSDTTVIGNNFRRNAEVTVAGLDEIRVTVSVTWVDGTLNREVELTQVFRQYADE